MMDSQKQFVDNFNQSTENFNKNFLSNSVNSDYFKKWYDSQMAFFHNQNNEKSTSANPFEFFTQAFNKQVNGGQDMFGFMNSAMNNWMNMNNNMNMFQNMGNAMNGNPTEMFQNWSKMMTNSYQNMLSNFGANGVPKEAFMGLFNTSDMYLKMYEFMSPMFKAMQEKTFTPEMFKEYFNAEKYKEMMDKMFQLSPEGMAPMKEFFLNAIKNNMNMSKEAFEKMKSQMSTLPSLNNDTFNQMLEQYNSFNGQMKDLASPFVTMMTPGKDREQMLAISELGNKMVAYQIREAQFRYMIYTTGLKAMETLSENMFAKLQNGEEVKDFASVYNEFLSTNDKVYGELFESAEYSKFQAEFTEVVMLVKKGMEKQMEKMMENVPVVNRTEMDELYQTVYEMKKHIRSLEKKIEAMENTTSKEVKAPATKAAKK
jgi:BMFP domain-containing protein YqiC